jgi:hypothetical protein
MYGKLHSPGDGWAGLAGPGDFDRRIAEIRSHLLDRQSTIEEIVVSSFVRSRPYREKGRLDDVEYTCATLPEGRAARYQFTFDDHFQGGAIVKIEPITPTSLNKGGIGFSEYYQNSRAIREHFPALYFSFKAKFISGDPLNLLVLEEIAGIGGKHYMDTERYQEQIRAGTHISQMVNDLYPAVLAISSTGFGVHDTHPVFGHNVIFDLNNQKFRLFDTDTVSPSNMSIASNLIDFIESGLFNGVRLLIDDPSLNFAMAMLQRFEHDFPGKLIEEGSIKHGIRYELLKSGAENGLPETDIVRPSELRALDAFYQVFGRFPKRDEPIEHLFRQIEPGYLFTPDPDLIGVAKRGDLTAFRDRLTALQGLGTNSNL